MPDDNASEEEWNKFYEFTRPSDFTKYDFSGEDGKQIAPFADDSMSRLRKSFYENGISSKQAKSLVNFLNQENKTLMADATQKQVLSRQKAEEALQNKWGDDYDKNTALANRVFQEIVPTVEERRKFEQRGYTSDVGFIAMLSNIGNLIKSDDGIRKLRTQEGGFKDAHSRDVLSQEYKQLLSKSVQGGLTSREEKKLVDIQIALGHDKEE